MNKAYIEHKGRVIDPKGRFKLVMAIALDPATGYKEGLIRCITDRSGDIEMKGNIDRSELYHIKSINGFEKFEIGEKVEIKGEKETLEKLINKGDDFIGLEDPDIWRDEKTGLVHVYFTIPIKLAKKGMNIHLGHAVGKDLHTLEMTPPVVTSNAKVTAKEISIAPVNKKGRRLNLFEGSDRSDGKWYSTVQIAEVSDMSTMWKPGKHLFHPKRQKLTWIGGHVSPGPLLSRGFVDVGEGKLLGFLNGREVDKKEGKKIRYGMFSVGLFIYDYEQGKIDWVSPEPLIIDSEAKTITFASQFVETGNGEGILYAHVDDSFVRAYTIKAKDLKPLLP